MAQFHGSDLEKIEEIYGIPKEEIIGFGSNVNPLGQCAGTYTLSYNQRVGYVVTLL